MTHIVRSQERFSHVDTEWTGEHIHVNLVKIVSLVFEVLLREK